MYKVFFLKHDSIDMRDITRTANTIFLMLLPVFLILKDCSILGAACWLHPHEMFAGFLGNKAQSHSLQGGTKWKFKKKMRKMWKFFTNRPVCYDLIQPRRKKTNCTSDTCKVRKFGGRLKVSQHVGFSSDLENYPCLHPDRRFSGVSSGVSKALIHTRLIDLF